MINAMRYWLISAGTTPNVPRDDWHDGGAAWREQYGNVFMFPRRARVSAGDRLVHHAVGSSSAFGESRFHAVSRAISDVEPNPHDRWPWQVAMEVEIAGPLLRYCPTLRDIDVSPRSVARHSHIRLSAEQGRAAERLLEQAASRHGSAGS